jgi:hypothetical protein
MYEAVRDAAYGTRISLTPIKIVQFDHLNVSDQRACVDCVGHEWSQNRSGNQWSRAACPRLGLASGTGIDAESGFLQCNARQLGNLAHGLLRKVAEIEEQVTTTGQATVACNHGSNRSFLIASLFLQKWHCLSYEQVRQLMTRHRNVPDGPLVHGHKSAEPKEYLRDAFCHRQRQAVPLMTRTNHLMRWMPIGCEYTAIKACADACPSSSAEATAPPEPDVARAEPAARWDDGDTDDDTDGDTEGSTELEPEPDGEVGTQTDCGHWADPCRRRCCNNTAPSALPHVSSVPPASPCELQAITCQLIPVLPSSPAPRTGSPAVNTWVAGAARASAAAAQVLAAAPMARGRGRPKGVTKAVMAIRHLSGAKSVVVEAPAGKPPPPPEPAKANGIKALGTRVMGAIITAYQQVTRSFPIPSRFRKYKEAKNKTRAMRREDEVYAEWFVARHRGDHDVCVFIAPAMQVIQATHACALSW